MLDEGAVRFEFPSKWIVKRYPDSVQIHAPADDCVLSVSRFQGKVSLEDLLAEDDRQILSRGEIVRVNRDGLQIVWSESRYLETEKKRDAISCVAIGHGSGVQCLITFDFWADQAAKFAPIWDQALRSLILEKADGVVALREDAGSPQ